MKKQTSTGRALSLVLAFTTSAAVWLIGSALAAPQAQPPAAKKTSDTIFKNIQVMKGVPVDDFMGTMGIMCAALGFDCSDCHEGAGTEKVTTGDGHKSSFDSLRKNGSSLKAQS